MRGPRAADCSHATHGVSWARRRSLVGHPPGDATALSEVKRTRLLGTLGAMTTRAQTPIGDAMQADLSTSAPIADATRAAGWRTGS
jgi:hypothetical protein